MEKQKDALLQQIVENSKIATLCLKAKNAIGSGFFVEPDKIVTNIHVLAGKTKITAITAEQVETERAPIHHRAAKAVLKSVKAVSNTVLQLFRVNRLQVSKETAVYTIEGVMAFDAENDLALLQVAETGVPLPLGNSEGLQRGEQVCAVGYPDGGGYKGMAGTILSAPNSDKRLKIKFKLPPNYSGGHSGGPVLNGKNEVIGVAVSGTVTVSSDGDEFISNTDSSTVIPLTALKALLSNAGKVEPLAVWQKRPLIRAYVLESQGDEQLAQEKPKEAIAHYDSALTLNPNFARAYSSRALVKDLEGDSKGAIADYDNAIRLNREDAAAYNNRGNVKSELGDSEGAIEDYDNIIRLNPEHSEAYNNRGVEKAKLADSKADQAEIAAAQQHYQDAIHDWTRAIKLDSGAIDAYKNRGRAKRELAKFAASQGDTTKTQQHYQDAVDDYTHILERNPEDTATYNNRGIAKAHLGDDKGAIEDYDNAIKLNPKHTAAYNNRGIAKAHLGDFEGAIEDYTHVLERDPEDTAAYNNRGIAKRSLGDTEGAIEDYNNAIRLNPEYAAAYNNRGVVKRSLGDFEGAIEDYDNAIRIKPEYTDAYHNRGVAKSNLGESKADQGNTAEAQQHYQDAIDDLSDALQRNPQHAVAYRNRGRAKEALGQHDAAKADFEKAKEIDPDIGQQ